VASKDIKTGDEINEGNIIALRANTGIEVSFWDNIIGKKAAADIPSGKPLENNDII
jgi:sialic acid synthase SpsE